MKLTKHREAIIEALEQANRPLSAKEVYELTTGTLPSIGRATIYRNLAFMAYEEEIDEIRLPVGNFFSIKRGNGKRPLLFLEDTKQLVTLDCWKLSIGGLEVGEEMNLEDYEIVIYGKQAEQSSQKE